MNFLTLKSILVVIGIASLVGCGGSEDFPSSGGDSEAVYDNTQEVEAFYRDNPERFVFATIDDLPADLTWENGADLPTFADPAANRGGRLNLRIRNMQQTLRILGPDSNGTLRAPLWSANSVNIIEPHPWADGYIPGLAKEWAIDPQDGRTVYFRLDPDARWSDGKPFTLDDLFFGFYVTLSPHVNQPSVNKVVEDNFERITRYDDYTFSFTNKKASVDPLFSHTQYYLMQRDFYREFGPDYTDRYHWRFAPVTGAYTLDESKVDRGRRITFDRVQDWWGDNKPFYKHRYNPDQLTFTVVRDDPKAFELFLKGEIDWHFLNETTRWYDDAESAPFQDGYIERAKVYHLLPAASTGLFMNALRPPLDNQDLRVGIQHSLNFEKVNEGLYRSDRRRIRSFSDGYGAFSHPELRAREFDLGKAAEYFSKAGFSEFGSDGVRLNAEGQRLSFLLTVPNRDQDPEIAAILKEQARKAGLELVLDVLEPTTFFTKTFEKNHQMALHGWNTGYSPQPIYQWELKGSDAGQARNFNTTNIKDEELDALIVEWDAVSEPIRAHEIAHAIQERVHEFAAWAPGLTLDYSRIGYWRYVKWPDYFHEPRYFFYLQSGIFWIDEDVKAETIQAQKIGQTFPPKTTVYERFKRDGL